MASAKIAIGIDPAKPGSPDEAAWVTYWIRNDGAIMVLDAGFGVPSELNFSPTSELSARHRPLTRI